MRTTNPATHGSACKESEYFGVFDIESPKRFLSCARNNIVLVKKLYIYIIYILTFELLLIYFITKTKRRCREKKIIDLSRHISNRTSFSIYWDGHLSKIKLVLIYAIVLEGYINLWCLSYSGIIIGPSVTQTSSEGNSLYERNKYWLEIIGYDSSQISLI